MRLLGIELAPDEIRIARAERRRGRTRLLDCARVPGATAEERREALAVALAWRPARVVAALPVSALAHRVLALPFRDHRRVGETIALELLGLLPGDPGELVTGHLPIDVTATGTRALAAAARGGTVDALRRTLADAGAPPERVDAALLGVAGLLDPAAARDLALVVADGARSAVAVRRDGRLAGLRALACDPAREPAAFDRELRWTLAALQGAPRLVVLGGDATPELTARLGRAAGVPAASIADVAAPAWRHGSLAACAVAAGLVAGDALSLWQAPVRAASLRRVAALAAAAALLAVADVGLVRWGLARRNAALVAAVHDTAAAALPPGTRIVAPRAQLEAAAGDLAARPRAPGQVLALLRELSDRMPRDVAVAVDELTLDGDVLRLRGRAERFESIDALARGLAASGALRDVAAEESRAAVDGRGVEFGVRATWRPALGAPS